MILKFTIRNLLKRPFLNLIKVLGLSLALSGVLLISLFLKSELTFDSLHKDYKRIYRLTITDMAIVGGKHFARVSNAGFVPGMKEYFPEIEEYVRLAPIRGGVMKQNENFILIDQAFECDSTFFRVFDCELVSGNPGQILNNPGSMIVSESFARRVFGQVDPVGIQYDWRKLKAYTEWLKVDVTWNNSSSALARGTCGIGEFPAG